MRFKHAGTPGRKVDGPAVKELRGHEIQGASGDTSNKQRHKEKEKTEQQVMYYKQTIKEALKTDFIFAKKS